MLKIDPDNGSAHLGKLLTEYKVTDISLLPYRARKTKKFESARLYGSEETKKQLNDHFKKNRAKKKRNRIIRMVGIISIILAVTLVTIVLITQYRKSDRYIYGLIKGADGGYIVTEYNGKDENVKIPEKATKIASRAFEDCYWVKTVELSDNIKIIESFAFEGCTNLKKINIPRSVEEIGYGAFERCNSLPIIFIPKEVKVIRGRAFYSCTKIKVYTDAVSPGPYWSGDWDYSGMNNYGVYHCPVYWGYDIES